MPLLDSIGQQDFKDFEIVIAENDSPQREQILAEARAWSARTGQPIRFECNARNLGYDGNIRRLVELARGRFCFFMGNDDLMTPGALAVCASALSRHPKAGFLLRGYAWFGDDPAQPADTVRYVEQETFLNPGEDALTLCYRRSGIISGYVIDRDLAATASNTSFDGTLYYQMHLTASVLKTKGAVAIPQVLVLCRDTEPPDFGFAASERDLFKPGSYTPTARMAGVSGALRILEAHRGDIGEAAYVRIVRDYARHLYPFLRDQLHLSVRDYWTLCAAFSRMPLGRFPSFYLNCIVPYMLGKRLTDRIVFLIRRSLGHTPRLS